MGDAVPEAHGTPQGAAHGGSAGPVEQSHGQAGPVAGAAPAGPRPGGPDRHGDRNRDRGDRDRRRREADALRDQVNDAQNQIEGAAAGLPEEVQIPPEPMQVAQLNGHVLDQVTGKALGKYGLGSVGALRERGEVRGLKRLILQIPLIGALVGARQSFALKDLGVMVTAPGGIDKLVAAGTPQQVLDKITTLGEFADAAKNAVMSTLPIAGQAAILGAGARLAIDGARWVVGKEKTVMTLARELWRRATSSGRSIDTQAMMRIVFGDRDDISYLTTLAGTTDEDIKSIPLEERMKLIKKAYGSNLDAQALNKLLPTEKQEQVLSVTERDVLANVKSGYEVARKMFDTLSAAQKHAFLDSELPAYLAQREFTNHLKAMAVRAGVTGFKTGLVGGAVSLVRGITSTGLLAEWASRIGATLGTGGANIIHTVRGWAQAATATLESFWTQLTTTPAPLVTSTATASAADFGISQSNPIRNPASPVSAPLRQFQDLTTRGR